jgi:hypothetical protein
VVQLLRTLSLNWNDELVDCLRVLHLKWDAGCGLVVEGANVDLE